MRKARRDITLPEVVGGDGDADPAAECRGADPDVDGDIEDLPLYRPNQLALRSAQLQMQAAQGAGHRL